jgi:hypothetical protein
MAFTKILLVVLGVHGLQMGDQASLNATVHQAGSLGGEVLILVENGLGTACNGLVDNVQELQVLAKERGGFFGKLSCEMAQKAGYCAPNEELVSSRSGACARTCCLAGAQHRGVTPKLVMAHMTNHIETVKWSVYTQGANAVEVCEKRNN